MQDLAATVEKLLVESPVPLSLASRRGELAVRIADVWQGFGGTHEGIEPFVRYWLAFTNGMRPVLREERAKARRALAAALRPTPPGDDAA
ncbi:MAG TPA: hypothetical protein VFB74_05905 [Kribbellaceae bacterium]|nr:hypothetical protein [Kribbellaceae bacterium]